MIDKRLDLIGFRRLMKKKFNYSESDFHFIEKEDGYYLGTKNSLIKTNVLNEIVLIFDNQTASWEEYKGLINS
jgi:hypothetical protein